MTAKATRIGVQLALIGTLGFAAKGILARFAYLEGLSVEGVIVVRLTMAAPLFILGAMLLTRRRRPDAPPRVWLGAMALGGLFLVATAADFAAIERIGASTSRVILFTYPGMVLLIHALRARRLPPRPHLVTFLVAWIGVALVAGPAQSLSGEGSASGVLLSLTAAASYAIFLAVSDSLMARLGSVWFITCANVGAAALLWVWLALVGFEAPLTIPDAAWPWMIAMVLGATILPFFTFSEGVRRLGSADASLIALVGPPLTVTFAWILLGETLDATQLAGALLSVGAVSWLQRNKSREPPAPKPSRGSTAGALVR